MAFKHIRHMLRGMAHLHASPAGSFCLIGKLLTALFLLLTITTARAAAPPVYLWQEAEWFDGV